MKIKLLQHSKLSIAVIAARTCYQSFHKCDTNGLCGGTDVLGENDKELLERLVKKLRHESIIEHIVYSFEINGISRACLQQVARHRHISLSVQSTRFCLKKLMNSVEVKDMYIKTESDEVNKQIETSLMNLSKVLSETKNDFAKYALPEAFKTDLVMTINARELRHFLKLRTSKDAMWEIRNLAFGMYEVLPHEHKFLYNDVLGVEHDKV